VIEKSFFEKWYICQKKYIKSENKHSVILSLVKTQHAHECMLSPFSSRLIQPMNSFFSDT